MKTIILIVFLAGFVSSEDPLFEYYPTQLKQLESTGCEGVHGSKCLNSTHLQFCADTEIALINCPERNSSTPYCSNDGCSSEIIEQPNPPISNFTCTGSGLYPDISDCSLYYLCKKAGDDAKQFQCPPSQIYNSPSELCVPNNSSESCVPINCNLYPDEAIVYEQDKSVLIICSDGGTLPIVFRCLDHKYNEYDPISLTCNFKCPDEGRYPDRLDCHKYYECFQNEIELEYVHQNCGPNFKFDINTLTCQPDDGCTPELIPSLPSTTFAPSTTNSTITPSIDSTFSTPTILTDIPTTTITTNISTTRSSSESSESLESLESVESPESLEHH